MSSLINNTMICFMDAEPEQEFDSYLFGPTSNSIVPPPQQQQQQQQQQLANGQLPTNPNTTENNEVPLIVTEENATPQPGPMMPIAHVIKSLIGFLSQDNCQPLWNYEDITAKGN